MQYFSKTTLIVVLFGAMAFPLCVGAETRWELQSNKNDLTLTGSCDADIHIELYESDNFELNPLYTAVAPCTNGTFTHDDNLLKWGIPDGEYKLVVESDRHTVQNFTIEEPPVTTEEAVAREAREKGLPTEVGLSANQIFENAQASFGSKLYSLETDLITMQESLKDTTYPDFIKIGLSGALSAVEAVTKKLEEVFFVVEQRDFVEPTTGVKTEESTVETTTPTTETIPREESILNPETPSTPETPESTPTLENTAP